MRWDKPHPLCLFDGKEQTGCTFVVRSFRTQCVGILAFQQLEPWAKALADRPSIRLLGHNSSAMNSRMCPGPPAEEAEWDRGRTGYDLLCAWHVEPWKAAFVHGHGGRIGMKSMQDTYRTPCEALHIHAPVDLYGITFVQHQRGDVTRVQN